MLRVDILLILTVFIFTGCGDSESSVHNQGKDCISCHSSFDSGVTIFNSLDASDRNATDTANGYKVRLVLDDGNTISYVKGRGDGNFYWKGDEGTINDFTVEILDENGKVVNKSRENSHNVGRLRCNSCHTQDGLNNAPGRVVSYDYNKLLSNIIDK